MKTNIMQRIVSLGVVMVTTLFLASCSDGSLTGSVDGGGQGSETPVAAMCLTAKADVETIAAGGSATISYRVVNADSVEVSCLSLDGQFQFNATPSELEGSVTVEGIPSTTECIVSAVKAVAAPAEESAEEAAAQISKDLLVPTGEVEAPAADEGTGGSTSSAACTPVTIAVEGGGLAVEVTADQLEVQPGEQTVIRWSATPTTASIALSSDNADEELRAFSACEGTIDEILAGEIADPAPAVGCSVVQPASPATTYTVTASDAAGNEQSGSVTIETEMSELSASLLVNDSSSDLSASKGDQVTLRWSVTPEEALVKLSADGEAECDGLPDGSSSMPEGTATCTVNGDTLFTLEASLGDEIASDSVAVMVAQSAAQAGALDIESDAWAFVGESVTLTLKSADGSSAVGPVTVYGQGEPQVIESVPAEGTQVTVIVPDGGVKVDVGGAEGGQPRSYIPTAGVNIRPSGQGPATAVAINPADSRDRYWGTKPASFSGSVTLYHNGSPVAIDVKGGVNSVEAGSDAFYTTMKDFPISAIALRSGGSEVLVGTTGGLFRSTDSGSSFAIVDWMPRFKNSEGYKSDYRTCDGERQPGVSRGTLVSLGRVCDIIAEEDGRTLVATDIGVFTARSLGDGPNKTVYYGAPAPGQPASEKGYLTYGAAANDLEKAGDGRYFAATYRGVYVSSNGEQWEKFGELGETFSVTYDAATDTVFAGTASGVSSSSASAASWQSLGSTSSKVLSLAVDPTSNGRVIIAGTEGGPQVSRDSGATFAAIPGTEGTASRSVAMAASDVAGGSLYAILIGCDFGPINESVTTGTKVVSATTVPQETQEEESGDDESDDESDESVATVEFEIVE